MEAITKTNFNFPGQEKVYHGKVRDVYSLESDLMVMVVSDRISAFDVVLPKGIPYKGQVLNQLASKFLSATEDIIDNWKIASPDPMVSVGHKCEPFKVEMVIRGYLTGHAWRTYKSGLRELCGVALPEGMKEHQNFPEPIITPSTKADEGHDEDISREDIIAKGIVSEEDYVQLEKYTRALFQRGTEIAAKQGLILVDTKYEFGYDKKNRLYLIDEIHTPDSSRYFYIDGYKEAVDRGIPPKQLSKEFFRQWLIDNDFQGKENQELPEINNKIIDDVSNRYIELFNLITGKPFEPRKSNNILKEIEDNIIEFLST